MSSNSSTKREFSRNMLQMKFMQRTAAASKRLREAEEAAEELGCQTERWFLPPNPMLTSSLTCESRLSYKPSVTRFLSLAPGRLSFGGFNPETEVQMRELSAEKSKEFDMAMETSIGDAEMAETLKIIRNHTEEISSNEMDCVLKALRADTEEDKNNKQDNNQKLKKSDRKKEMPNKEIEDGEIPRKKKRKKKHPNT